MEMTLEERYKEERLQMAYKGLVATEEYLIEIEREELIPLITTLKEVLQ